MNIFSFIKSNISILDVISEYTTLKKTGGYYKGSCPFHQEKTASFTVSPGKDIFYCFGCHAGGDVISFISKIENCSQIEAAKLISEKYSIAIPDEYTKAGVWEHEKDAKTEKIYRNCHELVGNWCHQQVNNYKIATDYLKSRGISEKTISNFNIGYFPAGPVAIKNLISYCKDNGVLAQDLINANILIESKHSNGLYSPFEDRIIFPIKDHLGRACAFGGRVFKPEDTRAKYYNSHDHAFYNKGSILFGLDIAKKEIQKHETVFLVEGYMDTVMMVQYGFTNTVATLGTACTTEHLKQLSRYAQKLSVIYDGDSAGQKAIIRLTKLCWEFNMDLNVVTLPKQDDPASFLTGGGNLQELVEKSQDIFVFFINFISSGFKEKGLNEKMSLTQELIETVSLISDPLKQDILLQNASKALDIPFDTLKSEMSKISKKRLGNAHQEHKETRMKVNISDETPESLEESTILENKLFYAILNSDGGIKEEDAEYLQDNFSSPIKEIFIKFRSFKKREENGDFKSFFAILNEEEKETVTFIIFKNEPLNQSFDSILSQFQKKHWKQIVNNVKLKVEQAKTSGTNLEDIKQILSEFQVLKEKMLRRGLI